MSMANRRSVVAPSSEDALQNQSNRTAVQLMNVEAPIGTAPSGVVNTVANGVALSAGVSKNESGLSSAQGMDRPSVDDEASARGDRSRRGTNLQVQ